MKILYLANNWVAWKIAEWLKKNQEDVVGCVVHPRDKRKFTDEILATLNLPENRVFDGSQLGESNQLKNIRALKADVALSVYFGFILKSDFLSLFGGKVINLHPSYLPHSRGAHSNVWSIVEEGPAGASMHWIDQGIDTGDILAQKQIEVAIEDTGFSLYKKTEQACVDLFCETWPIFKQGRLKGVPQSPKGSFHRVSDLAKLERLDFDKQYRGRDLFNILRALSFPSQRGAYFEINGKKYYLKIEG